MGYTKVGPWVNGGAPAISAANLDTIETQYDEAAADLATHNANVTDSHGRVGGRLPLSQMAGLTSGKIWRGNGSNEPEEVSFDPAGFIPSGFIGAWTGTLATIPTGWLLCDGNNGTPNLLAKMLYGVANGATNPGSTGGALSKTTTGHNHAGGTTGSGGAHSHSVTVSSAGDHTHLVTPTNVGVNATPTQTNVASSGSVATSTSGGHSHSTSVSTVSSHTHSYGTTGSNTDTIADIRPPYYTVAWIMKT